MKPVYIQFPVPGIYSVQLGFAQVLVTIPSALVGRPLKIYKDGFKIKILEMALTEKGTK